MSDHLPEVPRHTAQGIAMRWQGSDIWGNGVEYVTYADHVAAVAEAEARVAHEWAPMVKALTEELLAKDNPPDMSMGAQYLAGYSAALADAKAGVESLGQRHPKWDLISTHYVGCWVSHPECALQGAIDIIEALENSETEQ